MTSRNMSDKDFNDEVKRILSDSNNKLKSKLCPLTALKKNCRFDCALFTEAVRIKTPSKRVINIDPAYCGLRRGIA